MGDSEADDTEMSVEACDVNLKDSMNGCDVAVSPESDKCVIENPGYLGNFNIDTDVSSECTNVPHYIVNLNGKLEFLNFITLVYNTDVSAVSSFPTQSPNAIDDEKSSVKTLKNASESEQQSSSTVSASPVTPGSQPFFVPRFRPRGRGRVTNVPLDDVMEQKIRTYEGGDCIQQLEELRKMFPRFKRAYINRIFTRNMLNYDITYHYLKREDDIESEKCSKIKLIQTPKVEEIKRTLESKPPRTELSLQSHAYIYMGVPLGRCPPHVANSLYRRVIVTPEGNVESADEHEQKFLDSSGVSSSLLTSSNLSEPRNRTLGTGLKLSPLTNAIPTSMDFSSPKRPDSEKTNCKSSDTPTNQCANQNFTPQENTPLSGNRFFRTNRVCETEVKKRGYVNRELRNATNNVSSIRSTTLPKCDLDGNDSTGRKSGDAVKYMAKIGVISNTNAHKRMDRVAKRKSSTTLESDNVNSHTVPDEIESLDDDLNLTIDERKQLLSFFNEASLDELTLISGVSKKSAQILLSLRPFKSTADLVCRTSGLRHLSSNLLDSCKDILQMRLSIVRLLQKCERLTERVANHAAKLFQNTVKLPEQNVFHSESNTDKDSTIDDFGVNRENGVSQLLTQQPAILNPVQELKPYQLVGVNWLRLLHNEQVNGILADEMGLGKTVQAIAFLASLWENGDRGPHLIMCPSSTQDNWQRELSVWCPHLKVLVYQGSAEQRKAIRLKIYENSGQEDFNVLLTSYAIGTSSIEDRSLMKRVNFHYGIFDEAHMLKNMTSQRYQHMVNFRVRRRLLLTGTPLQNNLLELVSLLSFVMPEMFSRSTNLLKRLFQMYSKPVSSDERDDNHTSVQSNNRGSFQDERITQAKNLLQPFCLRRLKAQVLDQLPPKTSEVVYVPMTETQTHHYQNLVNHLRVIKKSNCTEKPNERISTDLDSCEVSGDTPTKKICLDVNGTHSLSNSKLSGHSQSSANMIMTLRKAANHQILLSRLVYSEPVLRDIVELLRLDPTHINADSLLLYEDLASFSDHQVHKLCSFYEALNSYAISPESIISGSGKIQWLNENLPTLISQGHRILLFSQFVIMLDVLEEFLIITNRRYIRLDGSTSVSERQALIDRFNSSSIEVFLLSTRAGGLGINLTGADRVIIHDIDFNPYNDRQAEDRCHRLGQKNPVHVIRLISQGTVEETMQRIANEKLRLEQDVTGVVDSHLTDSDEEQIEKSVVDVDQLKVNTVEQTSLQCTSSDLDELQQITERDIRSLLSDVLEL